MTKTIKKIFLGGSLLVILVLSANSIFADNTNPEGNQGCGNTGSTGSGKLCKGKASAPVPSKGKASAPVPTPEPISMFLFGSGLIGVGIAVRKRLRGEEKN